jgi:hypothetical protein
MNRSPAYIRRNRQAEACPTNMDDSPNSLAQLEGALRALGLEI